MKKEIIKIRVDQTKLRNEMHFGIQLKNKAHVFKDKTKYNRKEKHKVSYVF
jgi:hypothetical protein